MPLAHPVLGSDHLTPTYECSDTNVGCWVELRCVSSVSGVWVNPRSAREFWMPRRTQCPLERPEDGRGR
jgi:hypothetical protein